MSAEVVSYSAEAWDISLSIKVECLQCHVEWGWSYYTEANHQKLRELADVHNAKLHPNPYRSQAQEDIFP